MNSTRISTIDKNKVSSFFDLLSDIQSRLMGTTMPPQQSSCTKPAPPSSSDILTAYHNHMDMIVAAFAAD